MFEILNHFKKKYQPLTKDGLRFDGLSLIDVKRKKHVIMISKPFVFDNRKLPKSYDGLAIKSKIEGGLPEECRTGSTDSGHRQPAWRHCRIRSCVLQGP